MLQPGPRHDSGASVWRLAVTIRHRWCRWCNAWATRQGIDPRTMSPGHRPRRTGWGRRRAGGSDAGL